MPQTLSDTDIQAGQAVYSRAMLAIYDLYVLGLSNQFIWKNPTSGLLCLYNDNISSRHLDVGVGTGYYLDKCQFPVAEPEIALLDLNRDSLEVTAHRISRYNPVCYTRNVLEPISLPEPAFGSISINYLLHCIPGNISEKVIVFDYLLPHLQEGGVIFGSSLVPHGVPTSWVARKLMKFYNDKGIFHNHDDCLEDLHAALSSRFTRYEIGTKGCAVIFKAWK